MGKAITPRSSEKKCPKRPKCPKASIDAPFQSDITWDIPDITPGERPKDRAMPRSARRARLTDEVIASLEPEPRQFYVWDTRRKGLGVRIGASGTVAFVVKLNLPGKRSVWLTLKARTLEDAGIEYHGLMVKFGKGESLAEQPKDQLWQDVVDKFEGEHLQLVKPSTAGTYRSSLKLVREAFKNRPVRSITYEDVWAFHRSLSDRKRQANVCVQLCKVIFKRCRSVWGVLPREALNPVDALGEVGWKPYPEETRDVRLSDEQLQQIGNALAEMEASGKESVYPIAAVRFLFFTGLRLRNVLDLQWDQVDMDEGELVFKHHKTDGKVGTLRTPLNAAALSVLQGLPRMKFMNDEGKEVEHAFVFPGGEQGKPIRDINKFWVRMTKLAGLETVQKESGEDTTLRRHDTRHAHGNMAADLGLNLQAVAALLGHKDANTSARYSKRSVKKSQDDSKQVSDSLQSKLGGKR